MNIEQTIVQAAAEGSASHAIAYALLRIAKAIENAGESLALAVDGVADELREPEVSAEGKEAFDYERNRNAGQPS